MLGFTKREEVGMMYFRLREVREKQGVARQELSVRSGISRNMIAMLESGRVDCIKTVILIRLADSLGVQVRDLFF